MKREQIWCDHANCGREIQLKNWPQGHMDFNEADKAWEVWVPQADKDSIDRVYCSLVCLVTDMTELLHIEMKNAEIVNNANS